jgi:transposase
LNAEQLRELASDLIAKIAQQSEQHGQAIANKDQELQRKDREMIYRQAKIDKLTHEMAVLKRWQFGRSRELLDAGQVSLLDETIEADIAAIDQELENLAPAAKSEKEPRQQSKRASLPAELSRVEVRHDPDSTTCGCGCQLKRIGEDVSEKLDYTPGLFTVERHIRGKWACTQCETLIQAPVPAQIIDKGIPTSGLLAQMLVAKYSDHLPLYRQETIFGRSGYAIPRSTLAAGRVLAVCSCSLWWMP